MRISRTLALVLVAALALGVLAGCTGTGTQPQTGNNTPSTTPAAVKPATIRLGNLPTEDILPLWVAQQKGLFAQVGLDVQIVPFQSAQERDAAFQAKGIDGFMGDPIAAAELNNAGFKARIVTICLGATPAEGRFGIVSSPKSGITSLNQLANIPVGTSSGTIQEYVLDGLMTEAGVAANQIKKEEVKKVPARFELLMSGKLKAAALPEPFLSLAVKQGAKLVADDTKGANLSQTVLVFSDEFLQKPEGAEAVKRLLRVWNEGVILVNENPDAYRSLLVEKARLPKPVVSSYQINKYPKAQLPQPREITAVLAWMKDKKLLTKDLTYEQLVYEPLEAEPGEQPGVPASGTPNTSQTP